MSRTGPRRVVAVIQARLGSRRFPRKTLAPFRNGRPMIEHVVRRVNRMRGVDDLVMAVPVGDRDLVRAVGEFSVRDREPLTPPGTWIRLSTHPNPDPLKAPLGRIVQGPEQDVLWRYWLAATAYRADVVIRITGDCPLWSPRAGEEVLRAFLNAPQQRPFWSNDTTVSGWPDGTDVEVFSMALLERAKHASAMPMSDREHVTSWMRRTLDPQKDIGIVYRRQDDLSRLKLSVDTREDLLRIERLTTQASPLRLRRGGGAELLQPLEL